MKTRFNREFEENYLEISEGGNDATIIEICSDGTSVSIRLTLNQINELISSLRESINK